MAFSTASMIAARAEHAGLDRRDGERLEHRGGFVPATRAGGSGVTRSTRPGCSATTQVTALAP